MAMKIRKFARDKSGSTTLKSALLFGAVAMALSVLTAPLLHDATESFSENNSFGIDRVLTGSVADTGTKSEKYLIRRSVLSDKEVRIELE